VLPTLNKPHPPCNARGFTLIELMIVVAVVATLVALTAPSFKRMIDTQRLRGINAALVTDMQFARSEAASRNVPVWVVFDKSSSALTCYTIVTGDRSVCDCKRAPGAACNAGGREIRTVHVDQTSGITVAVPDSQVFTSLGFEPATGRLIVVRSDVPEPAVDPFLANVGHAAVGTFRNAIEVTGRPSVCSPGGQLSGVLSCPP